MVLIVSNYFKQLQLQFYNVNSLKFWGILNVLPIQKVSPNLLSQPSRPPIHLLSIIPFIINPSLHIILQVFSMSCLPILHEVGSVFPNFISGSLLHFIAKNK